jgi:hypothetical protein
VDLRWDALLSSSDKKRGDSAVRDQVAEEGLQSPRVLPDRLAVLLDELIEGGLI